MTRCQRRMLFAAILLFLTPVVGCLGEPIPKRVVAGTTFTLPFSGGVFGVVANQSAGGLVSPDPQRGNLRFALCLASGSNSCATQRALLVRYITRIFPDPGSPLGLTGETVLGSSPPTPSAIIGEPVVLIDVPGATPAGNYMLTVFVDPPGTPPETMSLLEPIEILAKPAGSADAFSDLSKLVGTSSEASASLRGFIPNPQLLLTLADTANDRPAAGNFTVSYPSKVNVVGAFESGVLGQNSIVRFKLLPAPVPNPDPTTKKVALTFIDPDQRLTKINLVFTLSDPNSPVTASNFQIVAGSQALYTATGAAMPITTVVANAGNSFLVNDIR